VPRDFPLFILIYFEIKNNYHNKLKNNVSRNFLYDFSFDIVALYDNEILFNIILRKIISWPNFG